MRLRVQAQSLSARADHFEYVDGAAVALRRPFAAQRLRPHSLDLMRSRASNPIAPSSSTTTPMLDCETSGTAAVVDSAAPPGSTIMPSPAGPSSPRSPSCSVNVTVRTGLPAIVEGANV